MYFEISLPQKHFYCRIKQPPRMFLMKISAAPLTSIVAISCIWSKFRSLSCRLVIVLREVDFKLCIPICPDQLLPPARTFEYWRQIWVSKFQSVYNAIWWNLWMFHFIFPRATPESFQFWTELVYFYISFVKIWLFTQCYKTQESVDSKRVNISTWYRSFSLSFSLELMPFIKGIVKVLV